MKDIGFALLRQELARDKGLARIMMNATLARWRGEITGVVLDIACGHKPSYWRFLGLNDNEKVWLVGVDRNPGARPTVVADMTIPFPFKDAVADNIIVSSFLSIAPDPIGLLKEVQRVLKSGGWLFLTAPMVSSYIPDPTDHWRFTGEAIRLLLRRAGFVDADIIPFGERFSTVVNLLWPFLRPRWLVALTVSWLCLKLDIWWEKIWLKRFQRPDCPTGYVARARKP